MKKIKQVLLFTSACMFFGLHTFIAQTTHVIELKVNTAKIRKSTVNKFSNFGQSSSISNENYTLDVALGDNIKWKGISTSSSLDEVIIHSINYEGGTKFFDKSRLKSRGGSNVVARISKGKKGQYEKYTVKFRVIRNGVKVPGIFKIDPKIRIRQ
jgi:hypothetical protein